ncbi:glycosyltransferase [Bifidobacterium saguini DSM 23967]|uniref:Glycosyltransferase n=2 Tax=Bifidobacterium saguini TaxID=762210 RepID=A0A087D7W8_9BIFI|nr:glycosyltransferase family 1 protein [Bifidobacterium saguini]KFI91618.1 glycosyltransferase [Bifidobacterium saguini DSM 23967]QTB90244.1 glycosyltransferase family 1 protein [Bifidobacterium saguini]
MNDPIQILQVVPNMNSGGIENYIMNMLRSIDRERFHFDFLEHHMSESYFDNEIQSYGCHIYRLPVLDDKNIFKYHQGLKNLFSEHKFDIVHGQAASLAVFYLGAAKRAKVPVRIIHSHGTSFLKTPKGVAKRIMFQEAKRYANVRLACSTEAGRFLFGNEQFSIAKNAIDTKRFAYDNTLREKTRRRLGVEQDSFLIGHIGRFNLQKNHEYLIRIYLELQKINPHSKLLMVGEGETKESIKKLVDEYGISKNVIFESVTGNPQEYYNAMDAFVMPSLYEGLPLAGIEAQCAGLPCFMADSITRETSVSNLIQYIPLDKGPGYWAKQISQCLKKSRYGYDSIVRKSGYDYHDNTLIMEQLYSDLLIKNTGQE